ncbi:YbaB/EbfC family nucleoid-associated protein [Iamia majanohamensis]|uniref:Nucleoid-associated protein PO878_01305 n=1 Tax=Iamia majanohamensis TaxID=467976 RepID=A0AAE9YA43_9ACTN|nr:YbaB/EbfC family nucleoid-associated protein [Iamia majanohamensis]WCO67353.1 YbaB/EbfC family nucleoid-associated protein [Iamia majanohamensis]
MADTPNTDDTGDEPDGPTASGPSIPAEVVREGHGAGPVDEDGDAFDLEGLLGGGGLDLGSLMEQASQMQQQMAQAQAEAASTLLEGVAGGGAVRVTVTGTGEYRSVSIDPAAVDPDDVGMLEDLVLAALHDAAARIQEVQSQSMGGLGDLLGGG